MAKVRGPLLSMSADGQIGQSQVYARWRGVPYVRQYITPSNPNTMAQQSTRGVFTSLDDQWKHMGVLSRAPWEAATKGRPLVGRNLVIRSNLASLREQSDMANWTASPGALGGLPPTSFSAETGAAEGEIDVTLGASAAPVGWELASVVVQAIPDRDPAVRPAEFATEAEESDPSAGSEVSVTLSDLVAGEDYMVSGWTVWTRPDGQTAYGPSLGAIASAGVA